MTSPTASRPVPATAPGREQGDERPTHPPTDLRPSRFALVGVGVTLLVVLLLGAVRPLRDPDVWSHLLDGQWIATHHQWVTPDPLPTLATHDLVLSGWVGDLAAAAGYAALGPAGLVLLRAACIVTLAVLLLRSARQEAGLLPAVLAACLGLVVTLGVGYDHLAGGMVLAAVCVGLWRRAGEGYFRGPSSRSAGCGPRSTPPGSSVRSSGS